MRNARAHKIQWSDPTVHSSTVTRSVQSCQISITDTRFFKLRLYHQRFFFYTPFKTSLLQLNSKQELK